MSANTWSLDWLGFFSLWVNSSWFCWWFNQAFLGKIYDAFPLVTFLAWYKCSTFWVVADVDKLITISISAIIASLFISFFDLYSKRSLFSSDNGTSFPPSVLFFQRSFNVFNTSAVNHRGATIRLPHDTIRITILILFAKFLSKGAWKSLNWSEIKLLSSSTKIDLLYVSLKRYLSSDKNGISCMFLKSEIWTLTRFKDIYAVYMFPG